MLVKEQNLFHRPGAWGMLPLWSAEFDCWRGWWTAIPPWHGSKGGFWFNPAWCDFLTGVDNTYKSLCKQTQPPPHRQDRSVENEGDNGFQMVSALCWLLHFVYWASRPSIGAIWRNVLRSSEWISTAQRTRNWSWSRSFWTIRSKGFSRATWNWVSIAARLRNISPLKEWSWHELTQSMSGTFSVARTCLIAFQACKKPSKNLTIEETRLCHPC